MKIYSCVVIDDESHAIERISRYIESTPELELVASFVDPLTALIEVKQIGAVDVMFLDIDMPKLNGIELATVIRKWTRKLVFVTAHAKYAYEAFGVRADDYLLKPYSLPQFIACIENLFPSQPRQGISNLAANDDFFFVRSRVEGTRLVPIQFSEIIMIESKRNYILIHTCKSQILTYMSLTEIAGILAARTGFIQVQRGFIIQKNKIQYIEGNSVVLTNGTKLVVGENYRKRFAEFVVELCIKAGKLSGTRL